MKKYYFKAEKLRVGYGKQPLIENIEICLEKGEILTLIGPNGAGKSTILKSITKQLALLGGTVYLGEQDIGQMSGNELSQNMAGGCISKEIAERLGDTLHETVKRRFMQGIQEMRDGKSIEMRNV